MSDASGETNLAIPLNGSLRHGTVYVIAKKIDGIWKYTSLKTLVEGREAPIELLPLPPPQDEDK